MAVASKRWYRISSAMRERERRRWQPPSSSTALAFAGDRQQASDDQSLPDLKLLLVPSVTNGYISPWK